MFKVGLLALCVVSTVCFADGEAPKAPGFQVSDVEGLIAVVSKLPNEGGTINLLPGTYKLKDTILIKQKSQICIIGSGWNTRIEKLGDGDAIVFEGNCWSCWVKNLRIVGDPKAKSGSGIVFRKGEWSGINVIDYCHMEGFPESGVRFEGNPKTPFSSNTVSNCWFTNNMGDQLYSRANNDFYITGNQFGAGGAKNPRSGCLLDHSSAGSYTLNYHWGNVVALRMVGVNFNRIENNRFEQSRESGIVIGDPKAGGGSQLNIITGNTIHTNSEHNKGKFPAVIAYDAVDTTFCQNQIFSWDSGSQLHSDGLVLDRGCKTWIVKDNIIRHVTGKALVYDSKAGHIVKDNIGDK